MTEPVPPARERWESDYVVWVAPLTYRCLICEARLISVGGFRFCPNCNFRGFASTEQATTITEQELEQETDEIVDDISYLDEE